MTWTKNKGQGWTWTRPWCSLCRGRRVVGMSGTLDAEPCPACSNIPMEAPPPNAVKWLLARGAITQEQADKWGDG